MEGERMLKTVRNPVIGHWVTFLQTGVQTKGELLQIEYGVDHGAKVRLARPPAFIGHRHQRFELFPFLIRHAACVS